MRFSPAARSFGALAPRVALTSLLALGTLPPLMLAQPRGALAQARDEVVWVQIEAQPSLAEAQARARAIAGRLQDVNGFALGGGWYGIVLGPYTRSDAEEVLRVYRSEGTIPRDSYIAFTSSFRSQFYPVGRNYLENPPADPAASVAADPARTGEGDGAADTAAATGSTGQEAQTPPKPAEESVNEARASERLLTRDERRELQVALKWAGFYDAAIDGAFGRGTRSSMAEWQAAEGYEVTGVLTTRQRAALMKQYNAVLDGLGLEMVRDDKAGIEMLVPLAIMEFDRYEPPFAHYKATGDMGARLLMISQEGDRATLYGLYDIMQTLEIVPLEGARERGRDSFTLTGQNDKIVSHTEARLIDDAVKGFTLVWPANDETRRARVLEEIRASFATLPGALDPAAGGGAVQNLDLVSGLEVRRPRLSRTGFFISGTGAVLTTAEAVENCGRITLDSDQEARVLRADPAANFAVLEPAEPLVPVRHARFATAGVPLQSEVVVAGFSYDGLLGAPTLTYGTLAEARGLNGEADQRRLALAPQPGDAGGPVFDTSGAVMGMLLPELDGDRKLPEGTSFALDGGALRDKLAAAGLTLETGSGGATLDPEALSRQAFEMTVLVSCWE